MKRRLAALNRDLQNQQLQKNFESGADWARWKREAREERDGLKARYDEINEIMLLHEQTGREALAQRRAQMTSNTIIQTIKAAHKALDRLAGGHMEEDDQRLCADLRALHSTQSPLLYVRTASETEQAIAEAVAPLQAAIHEQHRQNELLQAQIRDLQSRQGHAYKVLSRLWDSRIAEVQEWRRAQGIVYRAYLTESECQQIELALAGLDYHKDHV